MRLLHHSVKVFIWFHLFCNWLINHEFNSLLFKALALKTSRSHPFASNFFISLLNCFHQMPLPQFFNVVPWSNEFWDCNLLGTTSRGQIFFKWFSLIVSSLLLLFIYLFLLFITIFFFPIYNLLFNVYLYLLNFKFKFKFFHFSFFVFYYLIKICCYLLLFF